MYLTMNLEVSLVQQLITTLVCWNQFADQLDCTTNDFNNTLNVNVIKSDLTLVASTYISTYDAII